MIRYPKEILSITTDCDLMIYGYVQMLFNGGYHINRFSIDCIKSATGISHNKVRESLQWLLDEGVIRKTNHNTYTALGNILPKNNYIGIMEDDLITIWEHKEAHKTLLHFIMLMGSRHSHKDFFIDKPYTVGFMARDYFCTQEGISPKTVSQYNSILEKIGVVYFYRERENTNIYGRVADKEYILRYAKKRTQKTVDKQHKTV